MVVIWSAYVLIVLVNLDAINYDRGGSTLSEFIVIGALLLVWRFAGSRRA